MFDNVYAVCKPAETYFTVNSPTAVTSQKKLDYWKNADPLKQHHTAMTWNRQLGTPARCLQRIPSKYSPATVYILLDYMTVAWTTEIDRDARLGPDRTVFNMKSLIPIRYFAVTNDDWSNVILNEMPIFRISRQ